MSKQISIHDVANMAGVSIATVSRVLNERDRVAEKTRQSVEKAVKRLSYSPNMRGRALSMQRTDTLGLILPDFMGDYYGGLMEAVDEAARKAGLHLMVTKAKGSMEKRKSIKRLIAGGRVDGLILMLDQESEELLEELCSIKAPLVILDEDVGHRHLNNVLVDNRTGARDAMDHLIKMHGIRNLMYIGGPGDNVDSRNRASGCRDAMIAANIKPRLDQFITTTYDYESGFNAAKKLVIRFRKKKKWGIVAANDELARGVIEALIREGFRVPEDIAVIGYDDSRLAMLNQPALSSVRVPLKEIGYSAVKIILECLANSDIQSTKIILKGQLILRQSCGCSSE
jgi:DNA-binding LacI/PurR family transcriptional regulator